LNILPFSKPVVFIFIKIIFFPVLVKLFIGVFTTPSPFGRLCVATIPSAPLSFWVFLGN
jgi:hypothetical protein